MKYLFFVLTVFLASACNNTKRGSGVIIKEPRTVKTFDAVAASGSIKADVKTGAIASVIIETDDNIMPFVESNVSNGILKIKLRDINILRNSTVYVHIINPEFKSVTTSASPQITSDEVIVTSEKMVLKASSGSSINVKIDAPAVSGDASSGAEISVQGKTRDVNSNSSSGATINFSNLQAETAKATVSSGASISLFASISILANATSGGEINYKGGATSVKKNVSSGGSVNQQ
ncbi:MAG: DUF2807 domain-containing protein [Ferruginibacter sp.]|nr:DUF2807 domain-containing protein [Ferruginibacter sp.]